MTRVILLYGKDKTSADVWYPWIKSKLAESGIRCEIPDLPSTNSPKIAEWLAVIDELRPDANTILIGHSRGGMAILRWLEVRNIKVAKVILVAANSANIEDTTMGDFYSGPYNFVAIKSCCDEFLVFHSKNDPWVPYAAGKENAEGLNARFITFEDRGHFGTQSNGAVMTEFPELLEALLVNP